MDKRAAIEGYFFVEPKDDGRIEFGIRRIGAPDIRTTALASSAAEIAGGIMIAARQSHELKDAGDPSDAADVSIAILEPSICGIREFPTPEPRIILEFGFTAASLGMSITLAAARLLGEQLLAVSAVQPRSGSH